MKFHVKYVIWTLCLGMSVSAIAQDVAFKTIISKNRLGINEHVRVVYSFNKQGADNFKLPALKNFRQLSGPMHGTSFSDFNGKTSFEQTYTYTLKPLRKGLISIPIATIEYEGMILKSTPLKITITDKVEIPKDPNDPKYVASQNVHLVAEVSNSQPFVGESIAVIYKIYVDVNNVQVKNYRESQSPTFNGFWNQNIDVKWVQKNGNYQGRPHRYAILKKTVLIPQKSGKLVLDPMNVELTVGVPIGRRDIWGNLITRNTDLEISTGRKIINVKPLPIDDKPLDFNGAVGDFRFSLSASKNILKANEAAQIKVEVSGKGNLKLIELPKIETPEDLEEYEPEHKEKVTTSLSGSKGSISDIYTVVPQYRGKYKIPKLSFSYFSLEEKKYKTIISDELIINAAEGEGKSEVDETVVSTVKKSVIGNAKDIRFISTKTNLAPLKSNGNFFGSNLFYGLLLLPLIAIPIGVFAGAQQKKRAGDIIGNKRRLADRLAKKYLSDAKKKLGKKEDFYVALEKALHNYLKANLHVETSDISKDKIAELLNDKNIGNADIETFVKVLDDCDYARYTPTTNVMMENEYNNAKSIIAKIDKQL